jgi:hypothetical protein
MYGRSPHHWQFVRAFFYLLFAIKRLMTTTSTDTTMCSPPTSKQQPVAPLSSGTKQRRRKASHASLRTLAFPLLLFVLVYAPIKSSMQWRSSTVTENKRFLLSNVQSSPGAVVIGSNRDAAPIVLEERPPALPVDRLPNPPAAVRIDGGDNSIGLLKETNVSYLWSADVSPTIRMHNLHQLRTIKVSLVVSHCDKPLDWILDYFAPPTKARQLRKFQMLNYTIQVDRVQIFTKCGGNKTQMDSFKELAQQSTSTMRPREITITNLPNVGRCDHTYAYWLEQYTRHQQHTDNNDDDENHIILFLKDSNHRTHLRQSLTHLNLRHVVGNAVTTGFSCLEQEKMSVLRKSITRPITAVFYKSNYHSLDELRHFYMEEYRREEQRDVQDDFHSNYSTLGSWLDALDYDLYGSVKWENTTLIPLCIGGMFAATKGQIRKNHNDWSKLTQSLSRGNNIVEGHYCERSWAALLSNPLDQSKVDDIGSLIEHKMTSSGNPWHPIPGRMYAGEVENPKAYRNDQSGLLLPCCNRSIKSLKKVAPAFD